MADRMEDPNNDAEQDEGFVGATLLINGDDDDDEIPTGVENGDAEENAATPEQVANVDALDETIQKILRMLMNLRRQRWIRQRGMMVPQDYQRQITSRSRILVAGLVLLILTI
jgi:hypothetical protein